MATHSHSPVVVLPLTNCFRKKNLKNGNNFGKIDPADARWAIYFLTQRGEFLKEQLVKTIIGSGPMFRNSMCQKATVPKNNLPKDNVMKLVPTKKGNVLKSSHLTLRGLNLP